MRFFQIVLLTFFSFSNYGIFSSLNASDPAPGSYDSGGSALCEDCVNVCFNIGSAGYAAKVRFDENGTEHTITQVGTRKECIQHSVSNGALRVRAMCAGCGLLFRDTKILDTHLDFSSVNLWDKRNFEISLHGMSTGPGVNYDTSLETSLSQGDRRDVKVCFQNNAAYTIEAWLYHGDDDVEEEYLGQKLAGQEGCITYRQSEIRARGDKARLRLVRTGFLFVSEKVMADDREIDLVKGNVTIKAEGALGSERHSIKYQFGKKINYRSYDTSELTSISVKDPSTGANVSKVVSAVFADRNVYVEYSGRKDIRLDNTNVVSWSYNDEEDVLLNKVMVTGMSSDSLAICRVDDVGMRASYTGDYKQYTSKSYCTYGHARKQQTRYSDKVWQYLRSDSDTRYSFVLRNKDNVSEADKILLTHKNGKRICSAGGITGQVDGYNQCFTRANTRESDYEVFVADYIDGGEKMRVLTHERKSVDVSSHVWKHVTGCVPSDILSESVHAFDQFSGFSDSSKGVCRADIDGVGLIGVVSLYATGDSCGCRVYDWDISSGRPTVSRSYMEKSYTVLTGSNFSEWFDTNASEIVDQVSSKYFFAVNDDPIKLICRGNSDSDGNAFFGSIIVDGVDNRICVGTTGQGSISSATNSTFQVPVAEITAR